ncbi:hypothetical protein [Streptomyces sp. SID4982]|uniref:hypothetical protein n=1 Tax=Streptomyces sp. SID4982 TaxID=2690291 RepID=UPI00136A4406|nr:hypothetical protein [Streptomyces sp. SID4982]MYS16577.1 hypothetical protein [Streptomyces sp. SID4982]
MKWPFVSRRSHDAIVADASADRERIRAERDQAMADAKTRHAVAQAATERYADLYDKWTDTTIVNTCITDELAAVRKQLASADTGGWQARCEAAEKRVDGLQKQLDDALGLNTPEVAEGSKWQARRESKLRWDK